MVNRAVYSIYLDSEVREKARDYGLNISKICENTLKLFLQRLEDCPTIISETVSTSTNLQKSPREVQLE